MAVNVTLSLGLVSAQVKVESAVRDDSKETELKTVCAGSTETEHPPAKVNSLYRCSYIAPDGVPCGREHSSYHPYSKGRDNGDGTYTVIDTAALEEATATEDKSAFTTLQFVPVNRGEFDTRMVASGKVYYLKPKGAVLPYAAIREIIRSRPEDVFVTEWAYRSVVTVVAAVVMGDVLAIQQYAFQDAVQAKPSIDPIDVDPAMLTMMSGLVESLRVEWDVTKFTDMRKSKIAALLNDAAGELGLPATSIDDQSSLLMAQLTAYLADNAPPAAPKRKAPAKRTTRKKEVAAS